MLELIDVICGKNAIELEGLSKTTLVKQFFEYSECEHLKHWSEQIHDITWHKNKASKKSK